MAETVKKAKAPAKPKTAATKKKAVIEKVKPSQEEIAQLAHRFWAERGQQHGSHEHDWIRAEQELMGIAS